MNNNFLIQVKLIISKYIRSKKDKDTLAIDTLCKYRFATTH